MAHAVDWIGRELEATAADVRRVCRALRRSPGFTLASVLTLALGIGAYAAIFSIVNVMLIRPLPYRGADRLVLIWADMTHLGYPRAPLSGPELDDLRQRSTLFEAFGAVWASNATLTGHGDPEQLRIGFVSTNFFSVLGAEPALGRLFVADDETPNAPSGVLLSAALWQRRYGADPTLVGRTVMLNDRPTTVLGILPADFKLLMPADSSVPDDLQIWAPLPLNLLHAPRTRQFLRVIGRMREPVTIDQARLEVNRIARDVAREFPDQGAGRTYRTVGLQSDDVRDVRSTLLALFGGVSLLLAIAFINIAGLLVARSATRARETAVRVALGAGYRHLIRACVIESVILAALGAVAGLFVGHWGLRLLVAWRPETLGRVGAAEIDTTVFAIVAGTALTCGLLLSLAPLSQLLHRDSIVTLNREGRRSGGQMSQRMRSSLVVIQLALSVVLLVSAVLLARTFLQLQKVDPGFQSDRTLTFRVALPPSRYGSLDVVNAFSRRLQAELTALPGVTGVGAISHVPYDNLPNWGGPYLSKPGEDALAAPIADYRTVSPGLFETIGAPLVEGRFFTESDDAAGLRVVVVDDRLAHRVWPGQSAVGRRLAADPIAAGSPSTWLTVIGVVPHLRVRTLTEDAAEQLYFSARQSPRSPTAYLLRTTGDPAMLAAPVRQVVGRLDPQLPVYDVRPFSDYLVAARSIRRFTMVLAATFAVVALVLACVGVYGVVAHAVTRRRHEFGVRLALGARPEEVIGLVVREGVKLAAAGLAIGLIGAAGAAYVLRGQLFEVRPSDAGSYLLAAPILGLAVIVATWLPARRATRVNLADTLRAE